MSKIDNIEALAQEVTASTIAVLPKRCSYIRNWNSKCKACMTACKHDAIERAIGRLTIDSEKCVSCGACTCACPMSAMLTTAPDQTEIVREARECAQNYGGMACFTCEKEAEELDIDPTRVVILPCLNYLDEYLICGLFALGIERIALLTRSCEGCNMNGDEPHFPTMVKSAKSLVKQWGGSGKVKIFHEIPESLCNSGHKGHYTRGNRREAITQAGGNAMGYVVQSIEEVIDPSKAKPSNGRAEQVVVRSDDVFPISTYRGPRVLGMLDRIGTRPQDASIESRFWATIDLDPTKCKRCGCCATMCATRALTYVQDLPDAPTRKQRREAPGSLIFQPSLCMACGLCQDSCFKKALVVGNRVPVSYLDEDTTIYLFKDEVQNNNNRFGF